MISNFENDPIYDPNLFPTCGKFPGTVEERLELVEKDIHDLTNAVAMLCSALMDADEKQKGEIEEMKDDIKHCNDGVQRIRHNVTELFLLRGKEKADE